jgi:hypothetical protein
VRLRRGLFGGCAALIHDENGVAVTNVVQQISRSTTIKTGKGLGSRKARKGRKERKGILVFLAIFALFALFARGKAFSSLS